MSAGRLRSVTLIGLLTGVVLLCMSAIVGVHPLIVWNPTASAPIGFYRVLPVRRSLLRVGDFVLVRPDPARARLYAERDYLPRGVPLLKRIAAIVGQRVCEHDGALWIDDRHVANALPCDGRGRPLAAWTGCRPLRDGEIFVLMPDAPASLDGRYFGPTSIDAVIGRAIPLWTTRAP